VREAVKTLVSFYNSVSIRWTPLKSHILGRVVLSPPIGIGVGSEGYTEDWAIIEMDPFKVNLTNFNGRLNAIDLRSRISRSDLIQMMNPDVEHVNAFEYPENHLLALSGIIPDEEMRHPVLDQDGEPCLMVIKRDGLTVGRANNFRSYNRLYHHGNEVNLKVSKEWVIFSFDSESDFSAKGDSGSVMVDGLGRIGGLLTGGTGGTGNLLPWTSHPSHSFSSVCRRMVSISPLSTLLSPHKHIRQIDGQLRTALFLFPTPFRKTLPE
jgi:hypothetical protein